VAGFRISPFSIPHDAIDPVAFTVEFEGFKLGIATDLGHAGHLTCHQLRDCDALVLESNHDVEMLRNSGRPWPLKQRIMSRHGHLSNDDSMALVRKVVADRTRYLVLAHGSQECNRYEIMDRCASTCLADLGRTDIALLVARQDAHLPTAWL
jgi:phosphoribosyl 1,2-cyclic phosphodiesterase